MNFQTLFNDRKFQEILNETEHNRDSSAEFYRIRSLIELEKFDLAVSELSERSRKGRKVLPIIGVLLSHRSIRSNTSYSKEIWDQFKHSIDIEIDNGDVPQWLCRVLSDYLFDLENKTNSRLLDEEWLLQKILDLYVAEDSSRKNALMLLDIYESNFKARNSRYWLVKAQIARRDLMSVEATTYILNCLSVGKEESLPYNDIITFFVNTYGFNLKKFPELIEAITKLSECSNPCDGEKEKYLDLISHIIKSDQDVYPLVEYRVTNSQLFQRTDDWQKKYPHQGVFRGFHFVSKSLKNDELDFNSESTVIYAPGRLGRFVYLTESTKPKFEIRDAPFARLEILNSKSRVLYEAEIESLISRNLQHIKRRIIVNPGRVGGTLVHRILRNAGIESISETWGDWYLPQLTFGGYLTRKQSQYISQLETELLFSKSDLPNLVVKKLPGRSAQYIDSIMSDDDQAVFLFRELEGYLSSWRKMGANPTLCVESLIDSLVAYSQIHQSQKMIGTIWYEDVVNNPKTLANIFGDLTYEMFEPYTGDSQENTPLSREVLGKKTSKYDLNDYFTCWNSSRGPLLAKKLELTKLLDHKESKKIRKVTLKRDNLVKQIVPGNIEGSPSHYYHFLLGLLFPFVDHYRLEGESNSYLFPDIKLMNKHIFELQDYGFNVGIWNHVNVTTSKVSFQGWDHESMFDYVDFVSTRNYLFEKLNVLIAEKRSKRRILIINRASVIKEAGDLHTYGAERRSTPNLHEIGPLLNDGFDVTFLELENVSLREQINYFLNTDIVLAQHGAALANLVWCRKDTKVIEVIDGKIRTPAFERLSQTMGLSYHRLPQEHAKANININSLNNLITTI